MKIMVAYDGTVQSKEALVYGLDKARENGGQLVALHVLNIAQCLDYDVMDAEAAVRRESLRFVEEAKALIREKGEGVNATLFSTEGNPEEETISFAKSNSADILLCPPGFKGIINKYRKASSSSEFANEAAKINLAALSTKSM